MANKQSEPQKQSFGRVMHEFKHDAAENQVRKVIRRPQAISIALGASTGKTGQDRVMTRSLS